MGLLPAAVLSNLPNSDIHQELLLRVTSGEALVTLAWQERLGQVGPENLALSFSLQQLGAGKVACGEKKFVPWASAADAYLVTGRLGDDFGVCWIDAKDVKVSPATLIDGAPSGAIVCDSAPATLLARGEPALQAVRSALMTATLALSAELVGLSSAALEMTAEYLRTRVQFGKPIGAFQALQHRMVDYYNQVRLADASVGAATRALADGRTDAAILISGAKSRSGDAAELVATGAIQLHGAIGYTDEHDIGLFLKGALRRSASFGNSKLHRALAIEGLRPKKSGAPQ